jgi:hypothetical protein
MRQRGWFVIVSVVLSDMSIVDPSFGSSPASAAGAQQPLAAAMAAQQAV